MTPFQLIILIGIVLSVLALLCIELTDWAIDKLVASLKEYLRKKNR